jgi:hypothetical protein
MTYVKDIYRYFTVERNFFAMSMTRKYVGSVGSAGFRVLTI